MSRVSQSIEQDGSGVVDALRDVGQRRRDLQIRIKRARMAKDNDLLYQLIDELVPDSVLNSHDKTMPGTVARIDRRPSRR